MNWQEFLQRILENLIANIPQIIGTLTVLAVYITKAIKLGKETPNLFNKALESSKNNIQELLNMLEQKNKEATNKYEEAMKKVDKLVVELEEQRKFNEKKTRETQAYKETLLKVLTNSANVSNGNNQIVKEVLGEYL